MTTGTNRISVRMRDGQVRLFESAKGDLSLTTYGPFVTILTVEKHIYLPQADIAEIVAAAPANGSR